MHVKIRADLKKNPFVSVIIPAINVDNWENVIQNLQSKKIKIEIIFLGPFKPKFKLPNNCKHILTFVKPPQCLEIGYRLSKGNFIMQFADDCKLSTKDGIYKIHELWKKRGCSIYKLVSCKYKTPGHKTLKADYRFMPWDKTSPILPITPLVPKILLKKYGSYDKRFEAVLADIDLYMRLIRAGCNFSFANIFYLENKNINKGNILLGDFWMKDKIFLDKLWIDDVSKPLTKRKFAKKRNLIFNRFSSKNLLKKTQKPHGKWKYSGTLYNTIMHNPVFYFFKNLYNYKSFIPYLSSLLKEYNIVIILNNFLKKLNLK
jgi:hypothetical protein